MIDACNQLNRLCEIYSLDTFCPTIENADGDDYMHRKLCADFCGDIVLEVYEGRDGRQLSHERLQKIAERSKLLSVEKLDEATKLAKDERGYDPEIIRDLPNIAAYKQKLAMQEPASAEDGPSYD